MAAKKMIHPLGSLPFMQESWMEVQVPGFDLASKRWLLGGHLGADQQADGRGEWMCVCKHTCTQDGGVATQGFKRTLIWYQSAWFTSWLFHFQSSSPWGSRWWLKYLVLSIHMEDPYWVPSSWLLQAFGKVSQGVEELSFGLSLPFISTM